MPVLFLEVADIIVTVGVTLGVPSPLPMTVKVGTEGICIDGVTIGVKEDGAETRISVYVEG